MKKDNRRFTTEEIQNIENKKIMRGKEVFPKIVLQNKYRKRMLG